MKKNFTANLFFLLLLNLLIKPIYVFGIEVGIQNSVGPTEYGLYYAMFNFTFLFNVLLDMGINNFQKINVARDSKSGIANMATLVPLKIVLALVYMIVTVVAALLLGFQGRYWFFIGWLMLNHVLSVFLLLLRANLSGLHLFMRDSIVSVIDRLILVIGIGYLLWFGNTAFEIEWFVLFQTGAYLIGIVSAVLMLPSGSRFPRLNFSVASARQMIKDTWPFALLILLMTAYNKLDGVMLERLAPDGLLEAGIYAQAYRLIDAGNSFAFLYAGMLLPVFARLIRSQDSAQMSLLTNQGMRFLFLPSAIACIIVYFHSDLIMNVLYDQVVQESAISFRWLMGSFMCICAGYVFGTLMTASNRLHTLNMIAALSVALNFGLNFVLIPKMGAEGAAVASFSSLLLMALLQVWIVYRSGAVNTDLDWVKRGALLIIPLILLAFGLDRFVDHEVTRFFILAAISLPLFVLVGLRKSDLKTVIPSEG